jgi:hypothetical protein
MWRSTSARSVHERGRLDGPRAMIEARASSMIRP